MYADDEATEEVFDRMLLHTGMLDEEAIPTRPNAPPAQPDLDWDA